MSVDEIASMHSRYKALRANYKKSIIDTKNKAWEYFCSTKSSNFLFTFKAAFGKLSSPTNLQISTGDPASSFHSKVSLLLDSHFPSGSSPIPLVFNDCSPPSCLSSSEVEVVFRKLRGGKALGIGLSDYAIWKALYNSFPNLFFHSFNLCIQFNHFSIFKDTKIKFLLKPGRDPSSTLSYRPICLLSTHGKILERVFLNRFLLWITKNNILHRSQFGFWENRSCVDVVVKLVHHIKNTRKHKHTTSTVIDIKSAFDNVDLSTLFHIFHSYRIPLHFQKFIHSYLTNRSATAIKTWYQSQLEINAVLCLVVTTLDPNIHNLISIKQEHLSHFVTNGKKDDTRAPSSGHMDTYRVSLPPRWRADMPMSARANPLEFVLY
ncbi:putative 115 kDa protein in type-1 retrotransposable element R1DM [Trichonephila clavipes]|nr:putative 115 kDa protein in type-1 retrotransposable element R1DM [Trichonephila clavipes]